VSDVQPLEYESRLALLDMWAQEREVMLEPSVLSMVAERANSNVRELEGVFNQLVAQAQLSSGELSLSNAATTLDHFEQPRQYGQRVTVTIERVIAAAARHFGFSPDDLTGNGAPGGDLARQIDVFVPGTDRRLTPQIGEAFGGRSHHCYGCNKVADRSNSTSGCSTM
jgi:chromosomal replication initiator protein